MKNSRSGKNIAKFKKGSPRLSKPVLAILLGVIAAVSVAVISAFGAGGASDVAASTNATPSQTIQKRYKATRALVVDKQTGQLRLPTKKEVDDLISNLSTMTKRPESAQQTAAASGGIAADLDGGFSGVMLARPNADGTWETRCVFTLEEGIEFLGIQEDKSQQ